MSANYEWSFLEAEARYSDRASSVSEAEVVDLQGYREGINAIRAERPEAVELVNALQMARQLGSLDPELRGKAKALTRHPEFLGWLAERQDAETINDVTTKLQSSKADARGVIEKLYGEFVFRDVLADADIVAWARTPNPKDPQRERAFLDIVELVKQNDPTKATEIRALTQGLRAKYERFLEEKQLPLTTASRKAATERAEQQRAAEKQRVAATKAAPSKDGLEVPAARIIPVRATRNPDGTVDMQSMSEGLEALDAAHTPVGVKISPASIKKLGKDVVVVTSAAAATITGLATAAQAAETPAHALSGSRPAAIAPRVAGAAVEAVHAVAPEQAGELAGVNGTLKAMILHAAGKYGQNPITLAVLYRHYAGEGSLAKPPISKPNLMGFGAAERAEYEKALGKKIDWNNPGETLQATSWLVREQHPYVPEITGDPVIDAGLSYRFGTAFMQRHAAHLTAKIRAAETSFTAAEHEVEYPSLLPPGAVHVPYDGSAPNIVHLPADPHAKANLVPAGSAEKVAVDPLPNVNPAYKQIILNVAAEHHVSPQLMVAIFKTYNGTYTKVLPHPLNKEEGWMGLSAEAAHGINRDDFAASAEQAARMLANTATMPIGDFNHPQKGTLLRIALDYRFGEGNVEAYLQHPDTLTAAMRKTMEEYKKFDFSALNELAAEAHAAAHPAAHPAVQAPAAKSAAPVAPPQPHLPSSAPAQSKELSAQILSHPNIVIDQTAPHNRVKQSLVTNEKDGKTFIDDTNHAPSVTLSPQLQQDVLVLADQGFKIKITSATTGEHVAGSDHYKGLAIDIAPESNSVADYQKIVDFLDKHADQLKLDQVIYGGKLISGDHLLNQGQPLASAMAFYGRATMKEHKDHIHLSVLDSAGEKPLPPTTVPGQITPPQPPAPKPAPSAPAATAPAPSAPAPKPAPAVPIALTPEQQQLIDKQPLSEKSKQFEAAVLLALEQKKAQGAPINVGVGLKQAMLESGNGNSDIVFGVKGGGKDSVKAPTKEYVDGKEVSTVDSFKVYPNLQAAVKGYVDLITTAPQYADAAAHSDNAQEYLHDLQHGGLHYATDPNYEEKVKARGKYLGIDAVVAATQAPEPPMPPKTPSPSPTPPPSPSPEAPSMPTPSPDPSPSASTSPSTGPSTDSSSPSDTGTATPTSPAPITSVPSPSLTSPVPTDSSNPTVHSSSGPSSSSEAAPSPSQSDNSTAPITPSATAPATPPSSPSASDSSDTHSTHTSPHTEPHVAGN